MGAPSWLPWVDEQQLHIDSDFNHRDALCSEDDVDDYYLVPQPGQSLRVEIQFEEELDLTGPPVATFQDTMNGESVPVMGSLISPEVVVFHVDRQLVMSLSGETLETPAAYQVVTIASENEDPDMSAP